MLARLSDGELTAEDAWPRELELLRRTHRGDRRLAAFEDARTLADAAALDRAVAAGGGPVGPLHGLPVTVKDWIDVEGFPRA